MNERTIKRAQFLIDAAYIFVVVLLVYLALKYVAGWVLPFILAFFIATAVHPFIRRIKKWLKLKQEIASIIVMLLIYAAIGVLIFLLIMQLVFLTRDALTLFPGYFENTIRPALNAVNTSFISFMERMPEPWQDQIVSIQSDITGNLQTFLIGLSQRGVSALSGLTNSVPAFFIGLVFTIMLSFFISMQYDRVTGFIKSLMPARARQIVQDTRAVIIDTVFKYLRAVFTLMLITFAELSVGLLVLGQKNAIPIALGIALFDALPFFGTGAIVLPWALIELVQLNYPLALGLVILYAIIAFVRSVIEPKIVGDRLGLNPIVSLVSIYLGFKVFGVIGMIAMPVLTQIVLALNKNGSIRLFTQREEPPEAENIVE